MRAARLLAILGATAALLVLARDTLRATPSSPGLAGALDAVVAIDGAGCSGTVVVSRFLVLTAKHCVQRADAEAPVEPATLAVLVGADPRAPRARLPVRQVVTVPGRYGADLRGALAGRDLALLVLAAPAPVVPARLALDERRPDLVVAVGYRGVGRELGPRAAHPGRVGTTDARRIVTSPLTCPGDSGGPLLDLSLIHI